MSSERAGRFGQTFEALAIPFGALAVAMVVFGLFMERFVYRPDSKESIPYPPGAHETIVDGLWRVVNMPGGTAYASRVMPVGSFVLPRTVQS